MISLTDEVKRSILVKGNENSLFRIFERLSIKDISGYLGEVLDDVHNERDGQSKVYLRSFCKALVNASNENPLDERLIQHLKNISLATSKLNLDQQKSTFAEIDALGHLKNAFFEISVAQIDERGGKSGKTPDIQVGSDLFVEVYCPQDSNNERERVKEEFQKQTGPVKMVLSRPVTGSSTDARQYPTNQTIARMVGAKRNHNQTRIGFKNLLWIDYKHKLNLNVENSLPYKSVNHADQTYFGCFGIWHAFYGSLGKSIFPKDRYSLAYAQCLDGDTYLQKDHDGLFKIRKELSGAILSFNDGNVLFLNPWCAMPLADNEIKSLTRIYQFRPEYSFFVKQTLEADVDSKEASISFLLETKREDNQ